MGYAQQKFASEIVNTGYGGHMKCPEVTKTILLLMMTPFHFVWQPRLLSQSASVEPLYNAASVLTLTKKVVIKIMKSLYKMTGHHTKVKGHSK